MFDEGLDLVRRGHAEARRLISGVRPPILDEAGVMAAILHLVNERGLQQKPKIKVQSRVRFARLVPILENAVYRIVQEGLNNACKHSQTERVRLRLWQRGGRLRIEIRDWGVGFDATLAHDNRYGLAGIRQRARLLGGKFRIRSEPGKGTLVIVEVPIVERTAEE
jgi:signal transduction histidine kinase